MKQGGLLEDLAASLGGHWDGQIFGRPCGAASLERPPARVLGSLEAIACTEPPITALAKPVRHSDIIH